MHTNLFTKYVTDLDNKLNSYQKDKVCVGGGGGNKLGGWDQHIHTIMYTTDNQHRPTIQHRELYSRYFVITYMGKESQV